MYDVSYEVDFPVNKRWSADAILYADRERQIAQGHNRGKSCLFFGIHSLIMDSHVTIDYSIPEKSAHNKSNAAERCEKMQTGEIGEKEFTWKKTWLILCVVSIILGTILSIFFLYFPQVLEYLSTLTSPATSPSDGKCSTENGQALAGDVKTISVPLVGREK